MIESNPTALKGASGPAPLRRPGAIRRTSSISTVWPEGRGQPMLMTGEARDIITPPQGGAPLVVAQGWCEILASPRREILRIATRPDFPALQSLVGQRAGGNLRLKLAEVIPQEKAAGSPLYLLLDDYCGASLVAGWAWSRWTTDWMAEIRKSGALPTAGRGGRMEGVCIGFAPGSTALNADGTGNTTNQSATPVPEIVNPEDPMGWHEMIPQAGVAFRRMRRTDVWRDAGLIHIDVQFQDSGTAPGGGRIAVHEYLLTATADASTSTLLALQPEPRILPYRECPGAVAHAQKMLGQTLPDFRQAVLDTLPETLGCTHLNDVLRSLAEVPQLAAALA